MRTDRRIAARLATAEGSAITNDTDDRASTAAMTNAGLIRHRPVLAALAAAYIMMAGPIGPLVAAEPTGSRYTPIVRSSTEGAIR